MIQDQNDENPMRKGGASWLALDDLLRPVKETCDAHFGLSGASFRSIDVA